MRRLSDIRDVPPVPSEQARAVSQPGLLEHLFALFAITVFLGALRGVVRPDGPSFQLGDAAPERTALLFTIYVISAGLLFVYCRYDLLNVVRRNKLLICLVAYTVASTLWAVDSGVSFRRSVALSLSFVFCVYLVLRFEIRRILEMVVVVMAAASLVSLLIGSTKIGPTDTERLHGVFGQPTWFGRVAALGILLTVSMWRLPWAFRKFDIPVLGLFGVCLVLTQTVTPTLSLVVGLAALAVFSVKPSSTSGPIPRLVIAILIVAPVAALVYTYYYDILELVGRDPSLTHRTYLWDAAIDKGPESALFGSGFRSFWIFPYSYDVNYNTHGSYGTRLGNGHSGYLDLWLELGWIGVGLVLGVFAQLFFRALGRLQDGHANIVAFFPAFLAFVLPYSVAEQIILEHSEMTWMLVMIGVIGLEKNTWLIRQSKHPPAISDAS